MLRWPTLCLVLLLSVRPAGHAAAAEATDLGTWRQAALERVNASRQEHGRPPLELEASLNRAAQAHAEDMLRRDYYSHVSPEGETVMDRYIEAGGGRWHRVAENIAHCADCQPPFTEADIERLHAGWMDSPDHRKNILAPGLDRFGFGVATNDAGGFYAVQTFAGPGTSPGTESGGTPPPMAPSEQAGRFLTAINQERQKEGVPPLESSEALSEAARSLVPEENLDRFRLDDIGNPSALLSSGQEARWRSLAMIAGECGGCGAALSAADPAYFVGRWLETPQHREQILNPELTHFGGVVRADGEGRKLALAILGRR